jgi:hypothetical protein
VLFATYRNKHLILRIIEDKDVPHGVRSQYNYGTIATSAHGAIIMKPNGQAWHKEVDAGEFLYYVEIIDWKKKPLTKEIVEAAIATYGKMIAQCLGYEMVYHGLELYEAIYKDGYLPDQRSIERSIEDEE